MTIDTLRTPFIMTVALAALASPGFADDDVARYLAARQPAWLAEQARETGDAREGAIVFHSRRVGCAACHSVTDDNDSSKLGPNLARWAREVDDAFLVESLLHPSKHIEPGFRASKLLLADGRVLTGMVIDENRSRVLLRTDSSANETVEIPRGEIEEQFQSDVSLMPEGQMQALQSVDEFYDLIAYLKAIRDGGPQTAKRLQPSPDELQLTLPEYESRVDHAGLIETWDDESFDRGAEIYELKCARCHGTRQREGSLPTARRFATGTFKNGHDPYAMYQTLTRGEGLMLPQTWMVPRQKYDVIHYIREEFLRDRDDIALRQLTDDYLDSLPQGDTFGPEPVLHEPWQEMDYGPMMMTTIEIGDDGHNIAQKGIAIRLDPGPGGIADGHRWILYEHDTLRCAGVWSGDEFIDWRGIQFDGRHGVHPRAAGEVLFENPTGPGWAEPESGSLADQARVQGRDGRSYGPLPDEWASYRGVRRYGEDVVLEYSVGETRIHETPRMLPAPELQDASIGVVRSFRIGPRVVPLRLLAVTLPRSATPVVDGHQVTVRRDPGEPALVIGVAQRDANVQWSVQNRQVVLAVPEGSVDLRFDLFVAELGESSPRAWKDCAAAARRIGDQAWTTIGKHRDGRLTEPAPRPLETTPDTWFEEGTWAVDDLTLPRDNPWQARLRLTGLDFYPGGDAMAVTTWDGNVWRVEGLKSLNKPDPKLTWHRIASGLFQPLGIKTLPDGLMVTCRDQLMKLRDTDGNGVMDDYRCFNSDHQVTEHFHEFAMGLARDDGGNWYYAKSARHALPAVVPHHGTLLRVSPDGRHTEILATGFRAANGVCLNPDGNFIVTDQEGHWNPKNRINWVRKGGFYGNMLGYHDVTDSSDSAMQQPLCWITNDFDRSPAELLWVPKRAWGPLGGSLLNLSYGYGRVYVVPHEFVGRQPQGGMCPLPIPDLPTGIIRGKFSPHDRQLYVGGLFAWASSRQQEDGGLYRIRYTGGEPVLPVGYHVGDQSIELTLSCDLDEARVAELGRYKITAWDIRRTKKYGSDHYNERNWPVTGATLDPDDRTIRLRVPELEPTWCFSLEAEIPTADGADREIEMHGTIHAAAGGTAADPRSTGREATTVNRLGRESEERNPR